jgi:hypothetical protein
MDGYMLITGSSRIGKTSSVHFITILEGQVGELKASDARSKKLVCCQIKLKPGDKVKLMKYG